MVMRCLLSWCALCAVALLAAEPIELLLPATRDARSGGALMAEDAGLFLRAGLEVRVRRLAPGEDALLALGPTRQACALVGDHLLRAWAAELPVVLVGVFTREPPRMLVVRSDGGPASLGELLRLPADRRPNWPEPADLGLQIAARRSGSDPDQAFPRGQAVLADFVRGEVSAFPATSRDRAHLARLGIAVRVLPGAGHAFGLGLAADAELVRRRPEAVAALFTAMRAGWDEARRAPTRLVDLLQAEGTPRSEVAQDVEGVLASMSDVPHPAVTALAVVAEGARLAGLPAAAPPERLWQPGAPPPPSPATQEPASPPWSWWIGELVVASVVLAGVVAMVRRSRRQAEHTSGDLKPRLTQEQLLPDLPQLPGWEFAVHYRPHASVSGDFYLASPMSDGRWLVAVGDVSGHGVQAALVVSGILKAGDLLAHRHDDLATWLCALQETVVPDLRRGLFVTMVVVALDPLTGEVECARAGHPPAFRSGPGGWIEVGAIGLAIGIGDNQAFRGGMRTQRLGMAVGDDLLLFTDGLTEVMDRTGQEFGVVGLRGSVARHHNGSAQQLVDGLAHDAAGHGSGITDDDLTVLVIRRRVGVQG